MRTRSVLLFLTALAAAAQDRQKPPFALPDSVSVKRDVVYSRIGNREMHLDLFLPKEGSGPFPAVVYIHGGRWLNGSKSAFQRQAAYMATKGFAGACIEYRLSGEAKYPAAIDDAKAAVHWLRAHANEYRLDPARIGAAGGSAGGHLVALLGVAGEVRAVAAFNPVLDMVILGKQESEAATKAIQAFLGKTYAQAPDLWAEASPAAHIGSTSAPMLLLHGDADTTVPYQQSVDMLAKLKAAGVRAELFTAKGAKHGFFNAPPFYEPALERMESFFTGTLKR